MNIFNNIFFLFYVKLYLNLNERIINLNFTLLTSNAPRIQNITVLNFTYILIVILTYVVSFYDETNNEYFHTMTFLYLSR